MKDLRKAFGISQEQFAAYLGVPRSQVALAETGARTLQTNALIKASKLYKLLKNNTEPPEILKDNLQQQASLNKALQERIDECQFQLILLNKKMTAIKQQFEQCCHAFQLINEMKAVSDADKTEREKNLVEWIEIDQYRKLSKCGQQVQQLLQLQIDVLEFEVARASGKIVDQEG